MRLRVLLLVVFVCSSIVNGQVIGNKRLIRKSAISPIVKNDPASVLPIRRVILYSNGVAYIERRGMVSGNAEVNLSFKQSQVDDVLKSMVVLDLGQGRIGAVSYNSSLPASARTAEIPFSVESKTGDGGGISEVLSQLQGAKVIVSSAKGTATGSILTVEKRVMPAEKDKPGGISHHLVIASESGDISDFDLGDVRSVKLLEEGTRRDLNEFANATASTRRRDAKTITVTSEGSGQREMVVSYTIAAPIWKTTYRVVLDEQGKPFFQGWAIVDNVSEEDWQNVKLSLVSGSPVSFIQNLQKPLYRYRPVVPIPDDLNLDPQVYDAEDGSGSGSDSGSGGGAGSATVDVTNSPVNGRQISALSAQSNYVTDGATSVSDALVNEQSGVKTAATGSEIGDLFEYKIENAVTVPRNRSALIPIIQTKMDGERISIYNEATRKERPMGGMLLTNVTPLTFEGGSMTVLDRDAYAGEALMERLKPKERRLISFALDLGTLVFAEQKEDREPARLIKIVDGVFQVHYFQTDQKIYHITNQTDRTKIIYVEHPVRQNWELSDTTPKPDITTERFYRFRVELQPFGKQDLVVSEKQGLMDSYQLYGFTREQLNLFVTRRYIDDATRAKLEKLIDIRTQVAEIDRKLASFNSEVEKIESDQKRLRENIEALAKTPEAKTLIARYIAKANDQETRLEEMDKERKTLEADKQRLDGELAVEIKNFEIK